MSSLTKLNFIDHKVVQHPCQGVHVVAEESTRGMRSAQPGMSSATTAKEGPLQK